MEAKLIVGASLMILTLNIFASTRVIRSDIHSRVNKAAWILLVWLIPLVGAFFAIRVLSEATVPAPSPTRVEPAPQIWMPGIGPDGPNGPN